MSDLGSLTGYYLYEADKIILEVDEAGNQKARNVYGTNLILRTVDGETYYYLYNGHADVTALITREGTIAATYYYDAFGNILESTGEVNNNIRYSGYQYEEETGLYYVNARMYDPKTARFLQEDTYTGDPNDPLSLNLYTYCANNPLIYLDPTGHSREDIANFFKTALNEAGKGAKVVGKRVKAVGKSVFQSAEAVGDGIKTFGKETANLVKSNYELTMNLFELKIGWELNKFSVMDDETYKYYRDSALKRITKESLSLISSAVEISTNVDDFISGMTVAGNNNFYSGKLLNLDAYNKYPPDTVAYKAGKTFGNVASLVMGAAASIGGLLGGTAGVSISATGAGAAIGVPVTAVSTGVAAYGITIMENSAKGIVSDGLSLMSGGGIRLIKRVRGVILDTIPK